MYPDKLTHYWLNKLFRLSYYFAWQPVIFWTDAHRAFAEQFVISTKKD